MRRLSLPLAAVLALVATAAWASYGSKPDMPPPQQPGGSAPGSPDAGQTPRQQAEWYYRDACRTIERNVAKLRLTGVTVLCRDALQVLASESRRYDLVLCDPPYGFDEHARLAGYLKRILAPSGLVVLETDKRVEPELEGLTVRTSRTYGSARLTLLQP